MKHILYTNYEAYTQRLNKCTQDAQSMWTDEITERYADEMKHCSQDIWAIPIDEKYISIFTQQEVESAVDLPEDWAPKIDFPII